MTTGRRTAKRPHPCVLLRILIALRENGEMHKTRLAWAANVNYEALEKCLLVLWDEGLITTSLSDSGHVVVRITGAGRDAIRDLEKLYSQFSTKRKSVQTDPR